MAQDIYKQHEAAFASVSAYVVVDAAGERVATIALKYPRDGAGRLYAYVHLISVPMVRGFAGGYGYDKGSAAVSEAIMHIPTYEHRPGGMKRSAYGDSINANREKLRAAAPHMDSGGWLREIEAQGFRVMQAV
jgi:hypothetical protein